MRERSDWVNGRPYSQQYEYLRDVLDQIAPLTAAGDVERSGGTELDVLLDETWDYAQAHPDIPSPYKGGRPITPPRIAAAIELLNRAQGWLQRRYAYRPGAVTTVRKDER